MIHMRMMKIKYLLFTLPWRNRVGEESKLRRMWGPYDRTAHCNVLKKILTQERLWLLRIAAVRYKLFRTRSSSNHLKTHLNLKLLALRRLASLALLREQHRLDVWQDPALGNGHASQQFVKLLVISDGQLKMPGNNPGLLVISGSIACQLKYLRSEILHHCCQVHRSSGSYSGSVVSFTEEPVDATHWEL